MEMFTFLFLISNPSLIPEIDTECLSLPSEATLPSSAETCQARQSWTEVKFVFLNTNETRGPDKPYRSEMNLPTSRIGEHRGK